MARLAIAEAVHEIKNLMMVARLCVAAIKSGSATAPLVSELERSLARATDLTSVLLVQARPDPQGNRPGCDLLVVVQRSCARWAHLLEPVALEVEVAAGAATVGIASELVERALLNLLLNARDAGATTVRVAGRVEGTRVVVAIEDDGEGMDDAVRGQVFEPFFTTKPDGAGIGLYTVANDLRSAAGGVAVTSEPGRGSTFTLWLPQSLDPT